MQFVGNKLTRVLQNYAGKMFTLSPTRLHGVITYKTMSVRRLKTSYLIGILFLKYSWQMWLLIHDPPPKGSFLCPASNRFHAPHSCADWSQNMRASRWGRNRLMIYTFCSTSWRLQSGSRYWSWNWLAATLRSLCGNQAAFGSFNGWAAHDYIWTGPCKSLLTAV